MPWTLSRSTSTAESSPGLNGLEIWLRMLLARTPRVHVDSQAAIGLSWLCPASSHGLPCAILLHEMGCHCRSCFKL